MKKYAKPACEITVFDSEDIITTSFVVAGFDDPLEDDEMSEYTGSIK